MTDNRDLQADVVAASIDFHHGVLTDQVVDFLGEPGRIDQLQNLADIMGMVADGTLDSYVVHVHDAGLLAAAAALTLGVFYQHHAQDLSTNG